MNIVLSMGAESKLNFVGEYTGSEPLGVSIYMDDVIDVTNSADVSFNNRNNVVSSINGNMLLKYPIGLITAQELVLAGGYLTGENDEYRNHADGGTSFVHDPACG